MKLKLLFLRISSVIIDVSIINTFALIIYLLIPPNSFIDILKVLLLTMIIYFLICYTYFNQTPGKYLLQLKLLPISNQKLTLPDIIKREFLFKYLIGFLFPYAILYLLKWVDFNKNVIAISVFTIIFSLIFWLIKRETWWNLLSKTRVEKVFVPKKNILVSYLILLSFYILSLSFIVYNNNHYQKNDLKIWGFQFPLKFKSYPNNSNVKKYNTYLAGQHLNPKEYVFELFKTNDVVILCEAFHQESTAWDLISDIVADKRFIENVGNVFTEYGAVSKQSKVDSLLNAKFANNTLLEKSLADLMHYRGPHFFYFLKNINLLNNSLPDSLKIHEYFTDFDSENEYFPGSTTLNDKVDRDSIMAYIVINRFKNIQQNDSRKKCLVITNFRHAFGSIKKDGREINTFDSEGSYIFKSFPSKTANVMLNSLALTTSVIIPTDKFMVYNAIQYGKWDRAFEENKNRPIGFDFKGSPFGKDAFDYFPYSYYFPYVTNLKYEDVFTGFIFNKPIFKWKIDNYYPFRKYGAEKEYLEKHSGIIINNSELENATEDYKPNKMNDKNKMRIFISLYNFIPYFIYFLVLSLGIIVSTFHFFRLILKKNIAENLV
jgi:hypothetical protein